MSNSALADLPPFPTQGRGRPTAKQASHREEFKSALVKIMLAGFEQGTRWTTRGWCYVLEECGLGKNDFDAAENMIVELRKAGVIPLDCVLEDQAREWSGFEYVDEGDPEKEAERILESLSLNIRWYQPTSFWDTQDNFVVMAVEKRDLIGLFEPVCRQYNVPIANFRGSPDLIARGKVLAEFMKHWDVGRNVIALYCGDHDPAGLRMSGDEFTSNFQSLHGTTIGGQRLRFVPEGFRVVRFGLNADFIAKANLPWTNNLQTGQKDQNKAQDLGDPRHPDHNKNYVQDYIKQFGKRKVEANALVVRPDMGRDLCRKAIEQYVSLESVKAFQKSLKPFREQLRVAVIQQIEDFEVEV